MADITVYLDKRTMRADDSYPVKIIVYHEGDNRKYGLKKRTSLTEQEWEKVNSKNLKNENLIKIKKYIESEKRRAEDIIKLIDDSFSFDLFRSLFCPSKHISNNQQEEINTLWEIWETHIKNLKKENRIGLSENYRDSLKSFKRHSPEITINEITPKYLERYEKWMIENNRSTTTISMYVRNLCAILNMAIRDNLFSKEAYPFGKKSDGKYEIPYGRNKKKAINVDFLKILKSAQCVTEEQEFAKDIWFFSLYCNGMNMVDIFNLKYKDIQDDFFYFFRKKTSLTRKNQKAIEIYISKEVHDIIAKWGNSDKSPENYVFNVFSDLMTPEEQFRVKKNKIRSINSYMKNLCKKNDLNIKISTYFARHSFATLLKNSGTSIEEIAEGLGHGDVRVTRDYLDSFPKEHKKETAKKLSTLLS